MSQRDLVWLWRAVPEYPFWRRLRWTVYWWLLWQTYPLLTWARSARAKCPVHGRTVR